MKLSSSLIRKVAARTLLGIAGLVLLTLVLSGLILATEPGSRWVLARVAEQVNRLPGQQLSFGPVAGTLLGELQLQEVRYSSDSLLVTIARIEADWSLPAIFSRRVSVPSLTVNGSIVERTPQPSAPEPERNPADPLLVFNPLPVALEFDQVVVNDLQYRQPGQEFQLDHLQFAAGLNGQNLTVTNLALESELADIEGDLALTLADYLPMNLNLAWQYHQEIFTGSGPAAGNLSLGGDLTQLAVAHRLTQPFDFTSEGLVDTGVSGNDLSLGISHGSGSLVLPEQLTGIRLALRDLSMETHGSLDDLEISLATELDSDLASSARFTVDGRWLGDRLTVASYQLATDSGTLKGSASLNLADGLQGSLQYDLSETDPLAYLENYRAADGSDGLPLELTNLSSSGELTLVTGQDTVQASLQLEELSGELGNYPLRGGGRVEYLDGGLLVDNFRLAAADNQLSVTGSLAEQLDFSWQLSAPRLDQLMPGLQGRLNASGEITGEPADMQLSSTLSLDSGRYQDFGIDSLRLDASFLQGDLDGQVSIRRASLTSEDRVDSIETLELRVAGTESSHQATLQARSSYGDADLTVTGGFTDLAALNWEGAIADGSLKTPVGNWSTRAAVPISVATDTLDVRDNCWWQDTASVCVNVAMEDRTGTPVTRISGTINDYPLALFNYQNPTPTDSAGTPSLLPHLPETVSVDGEVDAEFSATLASTATPEVDARLIPREVILTVRSAIDEELPEAERIEPDSQSWLLTEPLVAARLEAGRWNLQLDTGLGRENSGSVSPAAGSIGVSASLSAEGALEGNANASLNDLGWLEAFVPDATDIGGSLTARVDLGGSLDQPSLAMDVALVDGQATVTPLGVTFSAINTRIRSQDNERIELSASVNSEQGSLNLNGQVDSPFATSRHLQAQLTGDRFQLVDLPDLTVAISPQLAVTADESRIDVTGDLRIPTLVLTLRELPESAVDVSRDAVVVDYPSDRPQLSSSIASEQSTVFNVPVVADVNILLGDNVSLNGFGFTSTVAGNLNIRQQANGTNLTYGELQIVRGDYRMYGQSLQIRGGKLLFFGPIDNPALDIRATRTVENVTVGVLMNGTVKNIRSQLFPLRHCLTVTSSPSLLPVNRFQTWVRGNRTAMRYLGPSPGWA